MQLRPFELTDLESLLLCTRWTLLGIGLFAIVRLLLLCNLCFNVLIQLLAVRTNKRCVFLLSDHELEQS
jgi:uncharacterized membrane protein YqhA